MNAKISKGQRYRHPRLRGTWRVKSATAKFVTLEPDLPFLRMCRIPADEFPVYLGEDWQQV